jgi:hypothetical protein
MSDKPSFFAELKTCGDVGNGTRFGTIRGFKKSWPLRSRRRAINQRGRFNKRQNVKWPAREVFRS